MPSKLAMILQYLQHNVVHDYTGQLADMRSSVVFR
jgi:hypothetical protein